MDFGKTIEVRTAGYVVDCTIEELVRKNVVVMHDRKVLIDIDLDRRGQIRR